MDCVDFVIVGAAQSEPDSVQIDGGGEVLEQRHEFRDLGGVGGHLGQLHRGFKLGRRAEIERQRDVLRDVAF